MVRDLLLDFVTVRVRHDYGVRKAEPCRDPDGTVVS